MSSVEYNALRAGDSGNRSNQACQVLVSRIAGAARKSPRGYFVILTLVFSAVFLTLLSALAGYIFVQQKAQLAKENQEKALQAAEAGLEYYKWYLAHNPGDTTNGTGGPGPYVHTVPDPEGGTVGSFSLDIDAKTFCGEVSDITITSTGWSASDARYKRTVAASYVRPSVAEFSHIVDANIWAGPDRVINGPYHSNQGVRMDGAHNAKVSSGVASWLCTSSFGCSPSATKNGVFGSGTPGEDLWEYPTVPVDFNGLTVNLATIKSLAQSNGIYIGDSDDYGWRVTFLADGTIQVRKVVGAIEVWGYSSEVGWQPERTVMSNTQGSTVYTVPADCPVVFVEDDVWLDGTVSGKALIAAADVSAGSIDRSVILNGNLTYANPSGDGVTVIGEKNILVGLQVPDVMDIRGIFIAQKGRFSRNHYCTNDCSSTKGNQGLPSSLDEYVLRSTLNTTGTVVSKDRVGTKWISGGAFVSGFSQRNDSFDQDLSLSPPPFTPWTSDDYALKEWREKR